MSDSAIRWVVLLSCAVLAAFSLSRLQLTNSITHFMPHTNEAPLVELSLQLVDSPLSHRMVISISGGPERTQVARRLAESLRGHTEVDWIESGFDEAQMRGIFELYFERRAYLVSAEPESEIPTLLSDAGLERSATQLRQRLARPDSMLTARIAPRDPLGFFDRILERIRATQPEQGNASGGFSSKDGQHAIVLLGLASSPFDFTSQVGLLDEIDREFERLRKEAGATLVMEQSGINRVAVASEKNIKGEVNLISTASLVVVVALFMLVFRSLRHLFIAFLTPLTGFIAALAVIVATGAQLHGITLAFGFVLLGVVIDYPIHLMNHHAHSPPGTDSRESLRRIRTSLLSSGVTTTLAFMALATSDFPGLHEMGLFATIGVPVSLGLTLFGLPAFLGTSQAPSETQKRLSRGFERLVVALDARLGAALGALAIIAGLATFGLSRIAWEDDPSELMSANPEMIAEGERVRRQVADFDAGRFVVALGATPEAALQRNDVVSAHLERAIDAGLIDRMMSMHSFLWSRELQERNLAAIRAVDTLPARVDQEFARAGFKPGVFPEAVARLAQPEAEPLQPSDFEGTALERITDSLVDLDGRWAAVTYLRGARDGDAIRSLLGDLDQVHYIDQGQIVADVYQGFRVSTVRMLAVGAIVVLAVLLVRYRHLGWALLAFLPPGLAALATFGLFGLVGARVNVVSAVSLLVVLGMGVDYGIFTVESARKPERLGATLSSLLISCLTSICVFGVLTLSEQTALRSLGLTVGIGTVFALAFSPLVHVLARRLAQREEAGFAS